MRTKAIGDVIANPNALIASIGFGLYLSVYSAISFTSSGLSYIDSPEEASLAAFFPIGTYLPMAIIAAISLIMPPRGTGFKMMFVSGNIFLLVAVAIFALIKSGLPITLPTAVASSISSGAGLACLLHCWLASFAKIGPTLSVKYLAYGFCACHIMDFGLLLIPVPDTVAIPAMALLAIPLLAKCLPEHTNPPLTDGGPSDDVRRLRTYESIRSVWQPALACALIGLAYSMIQGCNPSMDAHETSAPFIWEAKTAIAILMAFFIGKYAAAFTSLNLLLPSMVGFLLVGFALYAVFPESDPLLLSAYFSILFTFSFLLLLIASLPLLAAQNPGPSIAMSATMLAMVHLLSNIGIVTGIYIHEFIPESRAASLAIGATGVVLTAVACSLNTSLFSIVFPNRAPIESNGPQSGAKAAPARSIETLHVSKQIAENLSTLYHLSSREAEILPLLAARKSVKEIAQSCYLSENTVKTHIRNIYKKMDVHSREDLCAIIAEFRKNENPGNSPFLG